MHRKDSTSLSIIIVNWNTCDLLRKCLESIRVTLPPIKAEIIVVDNASSDGSAEMVTESFPETLLIRNPSNNGFAAANNLGLERASGEYVMLLNPDAELRPNAAQFMIEFAGLHPEVAVIGPQLLNSDGTLQKSGQKFPSLARELLHITKLYRLMGGSFEGHYDWGRDDFDRLAEVDSVCGACMLVRISAIDSVGTLDERFFMYYEEVDWCFRMKAAGWKVYYLPDAQVVHHSGQGAKQIGLSKMRIAYESQYLYFKKHHGLAQALLLRIISGMVLVLMRMKR